VSLRRIEGKLAVVHRQVICGGVAEGLGAQEAAKSFCKRLFETAPAATGNYVCDGDLRQPLHILMGVVGLVLLMRAPNIAPDAGQVGSATQGNAVAGVGASARAVDRPVLTEALLPFRGGALLGVFLRVGKFAAGAVYSTGNNKVFLDLSWIGGY